jgi:hypothetical protein
MNRSIRELILLINNQDLTVFTFKVWMRVINWVIKWKQEIKTHFT